MALYPSERLKHFWLSDVHEDLSFEELLSQISELVSLAPDQVDNGIEHALRLICNSAGIDESTIYLREIDNPDIFVLSYVLRDPSLPPPPTVKFTATDNFPWCNRKLIANEIIYLPDTQAAPEDASVDKESWKKYNVVSALVIPLSTGGGRPMGFWGIDSTSKRREWPQQLQRRLKIIADIFANTIDRAVRDQQLRESETRLRLAADTAGAGFWTMDSQTGMIWATSKLKELFGFKPGDVIDINAVLEVVHPEDRESMRQTIEAMKRGDDRLVEYRIVPSSESIRWVMSKATCHILPATNCPILTGITLDITERKRSEETTERLAGRLIRAQEEERSLIARELHDDICQSLALLSLNLDQLQVGTPILAKQRQKLLEMSEKVADDIRQLSHGLHSTSLDILGLKPAATQICKEFANATDADVRFEIGELPHNVSKDAALSLYRVLQESLRNAAKYSRATLVTIKLSVDRDQIRLIVQDNGVGFDKHSSASVSGLGLASMRERMLLSHGTFEVNSVPGEGTQIEASLPVVRK